MPARRIEVVRLAAKRVALALALARQVAAGAILTASAVAMLPAEASHFVEAEARASAAVGAEPNKLETAGPQPSQAQARRRGQAGTGESSARLARNPSAGAGFAGECCPSRASPKAWRSRGFGRNRKDASIHATAGPHGAKPRGATAADYPIPLSSPARPDSNWPRIPPPRQEAVGIPPAGCGPAPPLPAARCRRGLLPNR